MPPENVKEYYRFLIQWAFKNRIAFLSSVSTEVFNPEVTAEILSQFLAKKLVR
jgi:hypothetical protein